MSIKQPRNGDAEIAIEGDALRSLLLKVLAIAIVPTALVLVWFIAVREPALAADALERAGSQAAAQKAAQIRQFVDRSTLLADRIAATIDPATAAGPQPGWAPAVSGPGSVVFVPLGDLGTVNLKPGEQGIESHVAIDLARRAHAGELPQPEAVQGQSAWTILLARPAGELGVLLLRFPASDLLDLLRPVDDNGGFALLQQHPGEPVTVIAGTAPDPAAAAWEAAVAGTPWRVTFQPSSGFVNAATPGALASVLVGTLIPLAVLAAGIALLMGLPKLLSTEVARILDAIESRAPVKVRVPALVPVARLLRRLSIRNRGKIAAAGRDDTQHAAPIASTSGDGAAEAHEASAAADSTDNADLLGGLPPVMEVVDDGLPAHIFRAFDIRGNVDNEFNESMVEKIGQALAAIASERDISTLLLAHDARPSCQKLRPVLVKALLAGGVDVVDIGLAPAPLLHFGTRETEFSSGIIMTGGHGGDAVNGLKITLDGEPLTGEGIREILSAIRAGKRSSGKGRTVKLDLSTDYVDRTCMDVGVALPLKLVMDNGYGTTARLASEVFTALGCEVVSVNEPDAQRGDGERSLEAAAASLSERVIAERADLGVLFDADGDQLHVVTNEGRRVSPDRLLMLFAGDVLERNPGADIVHDVLCTRHLGPYIARAGGRALLSRSGFVHVRQKMLDNDALLGGEFSGHVGFADRWYGFDDAIYATARLLEILGSATDTFDELAAALPDSVGTNEILVPADVDTRRRVLRALTSVAEFPGAQKNLVDGIRVDYPDGWGLARNALHEEAISFRFEANDETALSRVQAALKDAVAKAAPTLELPF